MHKIRHPEASIAHISFWEIQFSSYCCPTQLNHYRRLMKYELSWACPNDITAVTFVTRATQPGNDEIGMHLTWESMLFNKWEIYRMPPYPKSHLLQLTWFRSSVISKPQYLRDLRKDKQKQSGLLLQKKVKCPRWKV